MFPLSQKSLGILLFSAITMLTLDFVYLSTAGKYFQNLVKKIQGSPIKFNTMGAVLCYVVLVGAINYFILQNKKLNRKEKLRDAFLLGFAIYSVFELTNIAIFSNWTWTGVAIDSFWGGILFFLVTLMTLYVFKIKN